MFHRCAWFFRSSRNDVKDEGPHGVEPSALSQNLCNKLEQKQSFLAGVSAPLQNHG